MKNLHIFILLITVFSAAIGHAQGDDNCVYTIYVKTGYTLKGGTDANISLTLGDKEGNFIYVKNLRTWGLMDDGHDYFEVGNLDVFSGRAPCIRTPVCHLHLASDGTGEHPGWYCDYVEVTTTGPHQDCGQTGFYVDQWLSLDRFPYKLTADLDGCSNWGELPNHWIKKKFVVGHRRGSAVAA